MGRTGTVERKTKETEIVVAVELEGSGKAEIETGMPFFDHMLDSFSRHGLFDIKIQARGDLEVDYHHTVEDVGLALGEAFKKALGDKHVIRGENPHHIIEACFKAFARAMDMATGFDERIRGVLSTKGSL